MIDFSTPLQGLAMAQSQLNRVSQRLAADPAAAGDPQDTVDLAQARNEFAANVDTLKAGDEMTQYTLNLLA